MPVTGYDLRVKNNMDLASALGHVNTASFLFGDDDDHNPAKPQAMQQSTTSPDAKTYLQLHTTDDQFPILVRREGDGSMQLSASSAALDLALSQSPGPEAQQVTDKATATRHRQSLPPSAMRQTVYPGADNGMSPLNGILSDLATAKNTAANRRSLEVKFSGIGETRRPSLLSTQAGASNGMPKLQSSYSTNDIPTLKSTKISSPAVDHQAAAVQSPRDDYRSPAPSLQSSLHNPTTPGRQSQDAPLSFAKPEETNNLFRLPQSGLQPGAAPFTAANAVPANAPAMSPYGAPPPFYGGYGMNMLNASFNNMMIGTNGQGQWPPPAQMAPPMYPGAYGGYSQYPQPGALRFTDNQSRAVQQRRTQNGEGKASISLDWCASANQVADGSSRFANVKLESLTGEIHALCKDQHGCRYLQKKLEDRNPEHLQMIFDETSPHVMDLMIGIYACTPSSNGSH